MERYFTNKRLWYALGLAATVVLAVLALATLFGLTQVARAADYPGAVKMSEHTLYKAYPQFVVRRDTSYRTQDDWTDVYYWYSGGFSLGPEKRALSACILLEDTKHYTVLENHMSVLLCDGENSRLVFVERTFSLNLP